MYYLCTCTWEVKKKGGKSARGKVKLKKKYFKKWNINRCGISKKTINFKIALITNLRKQEVKIKREQEVSRGQKQRGKKTLERWN